MVPFGQFLGRVFRSKDVYFGPFSSKHVHFGTKDVFGTTNIRPKGPKLVHFVLVQTGPFSSKRLTDWSIFVLRSKLVHFRRRSKWVRIVFLLAVKRRVWYIVRIGTNMRRVYLLCILTDEFGTSRTNSDEFGPVLD